MMNKCLRAGVLGLVLIIFPSRAFAQVPTARGWSITYADGRTITEPLRPKGRMWTPRFPRVPGVELPRNGRPLDVLDVAYTADVDDIVATVTLGYSHFEDRVTVAQVRVTSTHPAVVNELTAYGVEPIILAIVPLKATLTGPVVAEDPSDQLEIRIDSVRLDTPFYRVVVRNHSTRDLRAIAFTIYEGAVRLASGGRKTERNQPLVLSGAEYSFDYWTSQMAGTPARTPDRLVVTSVMWEDGSVDGDHAWATEERAFNSKRQQWLQRLLRALGDGGTLRIAALRSAFLALDRSDDALEHARSAALAELEQLERDGDGTALRQWVTSTQAEMLAWLTRVNHALQ